MTSPVLALLVVFGFVSMPQLQAQVQTAKAPPLWFEVTSIKPSQADSRGGGLRVLPGEQTYLVSNSSLTLLIMIAYDVTPDRISGGPSWTNSELYDIEAKAAHPITRPERLLMFQSLLADRFKLSLRRETRQMPVYALVVDKDGAKLRENTDGGEQEMHSARRGQLTFHNSPLGRFVNQMLPPLVGRPVVDKTGLKGSYDWDLEFASEGPGDRGSPPADASLPDLFTALRKQLGLRLEPQIGPAEFLIIEHAEKPTGN